MSQQGRHIELREKTQQLLQGPLKHVRAAALAAVLVPLASVAVSPAVAQDCASGGCPAPADVPVSLSSATVPSPCDFVTSGGFVLYSGKKANFGANGGCKNGEFWGHLNYIDHSTGYSVDSVEITGYLTPTPASNIRDVCGMATTNAAESQPVYFRVRLIDNGEPGVADQFGIRLSNGYHVTMRMLNAGMRGGGNVQLHEPNRSTTGPTSSPDEVAMCYGVTAPDY
jgi:hypothetical protein